MEQSSHCETVCLLTREKNPPRLEFEIDVASLQQRTSETATYSEIKAYVLATTGLKVSSLYIAQVKEKCGLERRKNHNIGGAKHDVPVCPPEKEQAIIEAFQHFGIL